MFYVFITRTQMNYHKLYNSIISRAIGRDIDGYTEKHHIIPKCIGGDDRPGNIAILTANEHYVAHQLLAKMYPNENGLWFALRMMSAGNSKHKRNNKQYAWVRKRAALAHSKQFKGTSTGGHKYTTGHTMSVGEKNGMYGKSHTAATKHLMSEKASNRSDEAKHNMSVAASSRKYTPEGRKLLSDARKGAGNNMYGKIHSNDTKQLMSAKAKNRPKVTCEHCNKTCQASMYTRWHGKNCKHKN